MDKQTTSQDETIREIARKHLGVASLEARNSDSLDFHELGVRSIEEALHAAFDAGQRELLAAAQALVAAKDNASETPAQWRLLRQAWQALRRAVRNAKNNTPPKL